MMSALMKMLSHASAKKKTKSLRVSDFALLLVIFNPFTATPCKIFGLKDARTCLQTVYFLGPITLNFNSMHFDGDPFTCQCEKQKQKGLRV